MLLLLLPFSGVWAGTQKENTYETPNRLFHIARSVNRNLVCYDANMDHGQLNAKAPIKVYWVNREEHPGVTGGLNYIQRKLAYGYKLVKSKTGECRFTLTAYPHRVFSLSHGQGGYECHVEINHQPSVLRSLFVKAHPRNPLKVEYVELRGVSLTTHQAVTERVKK